MNLSDLFKTNQFKEEIEQLKADNQRLNTENSNLQAMLTPEILDAQKLQALIRDLET